MKSCTFSTIFHLCVGILLSSPLSCEGSGEDNTSFLRGSNKTLSVEQTEDEIIRSLAARMKPRNLDLGNFNSTDSEDSTLTSAAIPTKQFFHLHHMKSGGTSLSQWINCGLSRQRSLPNHPSIPSASLSECSWGYYHSCVGDETSSCRPRIQDAAVMTYCSPLAVTNYFNWTNADAVTMMRHPVHRVWSMYRFQTRTCFKCKDLKQVYEDIDNNNTEAYGHGVCLPQLSNHITRNMQKNIDVTQLDDEDLLTDEERAADAVDSIRNRFTVVGVIEQLQESIDMFGYSFPWMREEIEGEEKKCPFPHSNASPRNNGCGANGQNMELPDEPDEETRKAIEEHNQLDIQVYEAALEMFELQKLAMQLEQDIE